MPFVCLPPMPTERAGHDSIRQPVLVLRPGDLDRSSAGRIAFLPLAGDRRHPGKPGGFMRTTMLSKLQTLAAKDYRISVVLPVFSETDTVRIVADWLRQHLGERLLEIIIVISPRSSAP